LSAGSFAHCCCYVFLGPILIESRKKKRQSDNPNSKKTTHQSQSAAFSLCHGPPRVACFPGIIAQKTYQWVIAIGAQ
jgi:hypothetical protein